MDMVLPTAPQPAIGHLMDVLMMVLAGGAERTPGEYQALIEPAGYTMAREIPLPIDDTGRQPPWRVLEFRRG